MGEAFIVAAVRTAGGRKGGRLAGWHPADLAGLVIDELLDRAQVPPQLVEDLIMGCVTQAGEQSFNIGRMAVLSSKLPETVPGTSVDRQCGSSQQALHFAAQAVSSGTMDIVIAAGVESMTRVPMGMATTLAAQNGFGMPIGQRIAIRYQGARFDQFASAEWLTAHFGLSRDELDRYAYESHCRAIAASNSGAFDAEIVPVPIATPDGGQERHVRDEGIRFDIDLAAIRSLKTLREGGAITAATSSQICDGASAVLIANEKGIEKLAAAPLARVHHMAVVGTNPVTGIDGPIIGTQRAFERTGLSIADIDLYEVNEAFACVPLAWLQALHADPARMNVNGGALALGHPLGSSGTKLMTTLVHALRARKLRYGLQAMCEGAGTANVTIVERL